MSVTNDQLVIQARNQDDYLVAEKVAEKMVKDNHWMVIASVDPRELWIHVTADWMNEQAGQFADAYLSAKKEITA